MAVFGVGIWSHLCWAVFWFLMVVTSPDKLWTGRMMLVFQFWGHSGYRLQLIPDQKF